MKRITTVFCFILFIVCSVFSTVQYEFWSISLWGNNYYDWENSTTPTYIKLTQVGNTDKFNIYIKYSDRDGASLSNIYFSKSNSINGIHYISGQTTSNYILVNYGGFETTYQPKGLISFEYVSGTGNSNYRYNVHIEAGAHQKDSPNLIPRHIICDWSNVPIQVYKSDGVTPITLDDVIIANGETPYYASFSWDKIVGNDYSQYAVWYYDDDNFLEVEMYDDTKTYNNYIDLHFWVDNSHYSTRNGVNVPTNGTYTAKIPKNADYECNGDTPYLFFKINDVSSCSNQYILNSFEYYGAVKQNYCGKTGYYQHMYGYPCERTSYFGSYNDGITTYFEISKVIVTDKNGKPYLKVYDSSNRLAVTIGDEPAPATHTVTIANGNSSYGDLSGTTNMTGITNDSPISTSNGGKTLTIDGKSVTAIPKTNTDQYTYSFTGWTNATGTITAGRTIIANFSRVGTPHNLTWNANGGNITVAGTAAGSVPYGTPLTAPTAKKTGYTFSKWRDLTNSVDFNGTMPANDVTYTAQWNAVEYSITFHVNDGDPVMNLTYTIEDDIELWTADDVTKDGYNFIGWYDNEELTGEAVTAIAAGTTGDKEYWAKWELAATPEITLNEDGSQHLDNGVATSADLSSKYAGRDVNVTLKRQLYGGSWNTICFPFSVEDLDVEDNELYDILRNSLYELQPSTTTATSDGMIINFLPLSYEEGVMPLKAGVPYLIRTSTDIDLADYKFENVRLDYTIHSILKKEDVDLDVQFIPVMTRTLLTSKKDIVVVGSRLYYPNQSGGSYLRAFRAYLHITNGMESNYVQPRIRIVDTGETITMDEEQEANETRKYIEDGILIIERGGVRYDAQGKRMDK